MNRYIALVLGSAILASGSAFAADNVTSQEDIASAIEVAFGVTATTRYISRGVAQSTGPAIQGYIEPSYGIFYAGVWASNVDLGTSDRAEIDLYAGIRPQFGDLSLDLGYAHYFYDKTGSCCGEWYAKAEYAFTEEFAAGGEIYYDHESDAKYGVVKASLALPHDFSVSGAYGTYFDNTNDWNVGISYALQEKITLDARYHDSNQGPAYFIASISFDSSFRLGR